MTHKLYYTITPKMEEDLKKFCQINKITLTSIGDFVIDILLNLSRDIIKTVDSIKNEKKITNDEMKETTVKFNGKLTKIPKNYQLRAFILTGSKNLEGLTLACDVNNAINRRDGKVVYDILDDFIDEYIHNEFIKIETWLFQYDLEQERIESKKETQLLESPTKPKKPTGKKD